jgi:hypothetical protein
LGDSGEIIMKIVRLLCLLLATAAPAGARAEWREAVTRHFIVYSEDKEEKLREAALDLEKYDYLLRLALDLPQESKTKLRIYLLRDQREVQRSMGYGVGGGVAGYYQASSRGPIAVGGRAATGESVYDLSSQGVLFHEYAHHLMLQYFEGYYPTWFTEGFAEYYGTARILADNQIEVGRPASHRLVGFRWEGWKPVKALLTARTAKDIDNKFYLFYSQGWLLVHYLSNSESRAGQLRKYLSLLNRGADFEEAMNAAFGTDATELDKELRAYSARRKFDAYRVSFEKLDVGGTTIRALSPAEQALFEANLMLSRGLFRREAAEFVKEVRRKAAPFPNDPYALAVLAEAEHLAGNHEAAIAAADRWLAVRPGEPRALARKALATAEGLAAARAADAKAWDAPRAWLAEARKAAPEDPFVLEAYYDVYDAQGSLPPARAQNALYHAMELVPQDERLRQKVAADYERRNMIEPAIEALLPVAVGAHDPDEESAGEKKKREKAEEKWRRAGEHKMENPREMLERLQAKLTGAGRAPGTPAPAK